MKVKNLSSLHVSGQKLPFHVKLLLIGLVDVALVDAMENKR